MTYENAQALATIVRGRGVYAGASVPQATEKPIVVNIWTTETRAIRDILARAEAAGHTVTQVNESTLRIA